MSTERVKLMKFFLKKYKTTDTMNILKQIYSTSNNDELNQWRQLNMTMANQIKQQATVEIMIEKTFSNKTYSDILIDGEIETEGTNYMTVEETANIFKRWCTEQSIDPAQYIVKLYTILNKETTRKIVLFYTDNQAQEKRSGQTRCYHGHLWLHTVQSQDFEWQKCLHKDIILIPELSISKCEQMEAFKKVT